MPLKRRKRKESASWKKAKTARKLFKKIKILFFVIACAFLTLLAVAGAYSFKIFTTPLASAVNAPFSPEYSWDQVSPLNILLVGDTHYGILRTNPDNNSYTYLKFPEGSDRQLDDLQKEIGKKYAISLDKYILFGDKGESVLKLILGDFDKYGDSNIYGGYSKFLFGAKSNIEILLKEVKTDLSPKELAQVSLFIKAANKTGDTMVLDQDLVSDSSKFDYFWKNIALSKTYREEGNKVMVINGAKQTGLAGWGTRVVENLGITTIDPTNAAEIWEKSAIIYKNPENATLKGLSRGLKINDVIFDENFDKYGSFASRADILVVLGFDKNGFF